jgi:hypothetical protein
MKRRVDMRRLAAIVLIVSGLSVFGAASSYCEAEAEAEGRTEKSVRGQVSSMDWVGGIFAVKWLDVEVNVYQEMTFTVPAGFKIKQGSNTIDLSMLEIGDPLIIKYYENSDGSTELISVNDSSAFGEEF